MPDNNNTKKTVKTFVERYLSGDPQLPSREVTGSTTSVAAFPKSL